MTINGSETPLGEFVSLRGRRSRRRQRRAERSTSSTTCSRNSTEKPETVVYVFDSTGEYEGRLKYSVVFSQAVGLAVDNSETANKGRVYVTSGNVDGAAIYGYPPRAAADEAFPLPEPKNLEPEDEGYDPGEGSGTQSAATAAAAAPAAALEVGHGRHRGRARRRQGGQPRQGEEKSLKTPPCARSHAPHR